MVCSHLPTIPSLVTLQISSPGPIITRGLPAHRLSCGGRPLSAGLGIRVPFCRLSLDVARTGLGERVWESERKKAHSQSEES